MHEKPMYFVLGEHTLGYVNRVFPSVFNVLAGKPQLGGHSWLNTPVSITANEVLRNADLNDFAYFRVSAVGHI